MCYSLRLSLNFTSLQKHTLRSSFVKKKVRSVCQAKGEENDKEEGDSRTIKRTGVYAGIELKLFFRQPDFDERLEDDPTEFFFNFGRKLSAIDDQEKWEQFLSAVPYTVAARRKAAVAFIHAKCKSADTELHGEAMHALWELVIDHSFHNDIHHQTLELVAQCLQSEDMEVILLSEIKF